jgi:hypothetical protein
MNMKIFIVFFGVLLSCGRLFAEDALTPPDATMRAIVSAILEKDLEKFQSQMLPEVAKQITKPLLDQTHANYAKSLGNKDNKFLYLGVIARADSRVFLWKITGGNPDDILVKITMINGKSAGVFFE